MLSATSGPSPIEEQRSGCSAPGTRWEASNMMPASEQWGVECSSSLLIELAASGPVIDLGDDGVP